MNEIYENGGFVTKYGSSPYDMIECLHIRLALWTDYPSLTSENFNEIFKLCFSIIFLKVVAICSKL
jgi:hypothetical protein